MCKKCPVVYLMFCKKFSSNVNISRKFVIPLCDKVQSSEPCFPLFCSDDNCYNQISMKVTLCKMTGCHKPCTQTSGKKATWTGWLRIEPNFSCSIEIPEIRNREQLCKLTMSNLLSQLNVHRNRHFSGRIFSPRLRSD